MNDAELLQRYVRDGSEEAFGELVQRHLNLVFAAALRQVGGDRGLAEDVAQAVFTDLARKARVLSERAVLAGWLYTSARFAAAKVVRGEQRRRAREENAIFMAPSNDPNPEWDQIQPVLDEAMHQLKSEDRNAIVLRFLEGKGLEEVGASLGVTGDAARMRIDRALEKLKGLLGRKGVTTTTTALALVMAQQTSVAAPAGLGAAIAASALTGAAEGIASVGIFEIILMSKAKLAVAALVLAGMSVPLVVQRQANVALAKTNSEMASHLAVVEAKLAPLEEDNSRLSNALARFESTARGSNELIKLRAEVAQLRGEKRTSASLTGNPGDPLDETLRALGTKAAQLRRRLADMPDKQIPELALVGDKDWLDAVARVPGVETDNDIRKALNSLRSIAKGAFGDQMRKALEKYAEANGGMLPTDLAQIHPYLEKPIDPAALQRYQLAASGKLDEVGTGKIIIKEIAPPVDDEYDSRYEFFRNGTTSAGFSQVGDAIQEAVKAYAKANNGVLPTQPTQVDGYLKRAIAPARVQQFLDKVPPGVTTLEQMEIVARK